MSYMLRFIDEADGDGDDDVAPLPMDHSSSEDESVELADMLRFIDEPDDDGYVDEDVVPPLSMDYSSDGDGDDDDGDGDGDGELGRHAVLVLPRFRGFPDWAQIMTRLKNHEDGDEEEVGNGNEDGNEDQDGNEDDNENEEEDGDGNEDVNKDGNEDGNGDGNEDESGDKDGDGNEDRNEDEDGNGNEDEDGNEDEELGRHAMLVLPRFRGFPDWAQIMTRLENHEDGDGDGNEDGNGDGDGNEDEELGRHAMLVLPRFRGFSDRAQIMTRHLPKTNEYFGNPEDYVDASGYETFLQYLAEFDQSERRGAPGAAKASVAELPNVVIAVDGYEACAICREDVSVGDSIKKMPCGHGYHEDCIVPWLESRNSCPVCPYELPTDDPEYEEERKKKLGASASRLT